jgi:hypothetical protein
MLIDLLESRYKAAKASAKEEAVVSVHEREVRDAYARTLELKIATPCTVINFVDFL